MKSGGAKSGVDAPWVGNRGIRVEVGEQEVSVSQRDMRAALSLEDVPRLSFTSFPPS